jgi:hypothetical protein
MTLPLTTKGMQDLASLRSRMARDYGRGRVSWDDFQYINDRLSDIEARLIEMAATDPTRLQLEEAVDEPARSDNIA